MNKYLPSKCIKFWWCPYTLNLNLKQDEILLTLSIIAITIATLNKLCKK